MKIIALAGLLLAGTLSAQTVIYDYPTYAREERRALPGFRAQSLSVPPVVGVRRVAVVNVTWPGVSPIISNATALSIVNNVEGFYANASYGQLSFDSKVYGPYTLPSPTCDFYSMKDQIIAALDPDVDFNQIEHVVAFGPFSCGWGGISTVGQWQQATNDGTVPLAISIMPSGVLTVAEHEIGHGLGLGHAVSLSCPGGGIAAGTKDLCTRSEYGDPYDVMGTYGTGGQPGGRMRDFLGWMTGRIVSVETSGTWTLTDIESASGVSVLKIRRSFNDWLYVTQRAGIGIVLHALSNENYGYERMEPLPYTGSLYFRRMLAGESYTDPTGLRVDVLSDGRVSIGYVSPDVSFPVVTITSPLAGEFVSGTVAISGDASPDTYLGRVSVSQNGASLLSAYDFAAPFAWTWDSSSAASGVAAGINIRVCDVAGNCSYGVPVTVYPTNLPTPTMTVTPTRTFTKPQTPTSTRTHTATVTAASTGTPTPYRTPTPTRTKPGKRIGRRP